MAAQQRVIVDQDRPRPGSMTGVHSSVLSALGELIVAGGRMVLRQLPKPSLRTSGPQRWSRRGLAAARHTHEPTGQWVNQTGELAILVAGSASEAAGGLAGVGSGQAAQHLGRRLLARMT